jgi:hypothetical protein
MKFSQDVDFPKAQKVLLHVDNQDLTGKTIVITGGNSGTYTYCFSVWKHKLLLIHVQQVLASSALEN